MSNPFTLHSMFDVHHVADANVTFWRSGSHHPRLDHQVDFAFPGPPLTTFKEAADIGWNDRLTEEERQAAFQGEAQMLAPPETQEANRSGVASGGIVQAATDAPEIAYRAVHSQDYQARYIYDRWQHISVPLAAVIAELAFGALGQRP